MEEELNGKMQKSLADFQRKLNSIRTNRANPDMLKEVLVMYYGTLVPLTQVASISVPDPRQFLLNVFDQNAVKDVEKAIATSKLQLTPSVDGSAIRIILPELTEDRRLELVKVAKQYSEEAKISIRNIRRDAVDKLKQEEKNNEITEDDLKKMQQSIQNITDKFTKSVDQELVTKEKELLTI